MSAGWFYELEMKTIVKILQFLNLVDLCRSVYPCNRQMKKMLETDLESVCALHLDQLPFISLPYVNKVLNSSKKVKRLTISSQYHL